MKKNIGNKVKKVGVLLMTVLVNLEMAIPVYAASPSIDDLPLYNGTMNLITAVTKGITGIAAAVGIFYSVKAGIAWHTAEEHEKPGKFKAMIGTIASSVVITAIPGALTWVLMFY